MYSRCPCEKSLIVNFYFNINFLSFIANCFEHNLDKAQKMPALSSAITASVGSALAAGLVGSCCNNNSDKDSEIRLRKKKKQKQR